MKRVVILILIFLTFIYSHSLNAYANENGEKQIIKVGYVPNYTTINEPIEKNYEGYGYEYFKEIEKYTNYKFEFIACTWADGKRMIKSGELDLFGPDGLNTEEIEEFEYTKNNFGYANAVLIAPIDMEIGYNDYEAFDGKKVGVLEHSVYIPYYEAYMKKYNITANYIYLNETQKNDDFKEANIDLRVTNGQYLIPDTKVVARLGALPIFYFTKKGNIQLIEEIDSALEEIYNQNFMFSANLFTKYYSNREYAIPVLTIEEQEVLQSYPILRVGYGTDYEPLQYQDEDGTAKGICIDLLNLIAQKAEIELEYIPMDSIHVYSREDLDLIITFTATKKYIEF